MGPGLDVFCRAKRKLVPSALSMMVAGGVDVRRYSSPTFEVLGTADELYTGEERDAAGQQHGEATHLHVAILAGGGPGLVPPNERPAPGRVVDVIEQAALRHEQCIRLEGSLCEAKVRNHGNMVGREKEGTKNSV